MKKLTKIGLLPFLTGILGSVGFLLQLSVRLYGIDEKNLLRIGHPALILLFVFTALTLAGIFYISRSAGNAQATFPKSTGRILGSVILFLCVIFYTVSTALGAFDRLTVATVFSGVLVLVAFIIDGIRYKKDLPSGGLFYGTVSLFLLFYMLSNQAGSEKPVQTFRLFFPVLTYIFFTMAAFYRAYLSAGMPFLKTYLFFHYGSVFFAMANLTDEPILCICFATAFLLAPLPEAKQTMELPENVLLCLNKLKKAGYDAFVVGGCVRDSLLGIAPNDYDMCTSATPKKIAKIFSQYELVRTGEKHGTIGVIIDGQMYEITTFRTEGDYSDNRHPDQVEFVDEIHADLARRDFTINAIAYSPERGYVDPFGGENDLQKKILRTVGDPIARFREDALRILRGLRFSARFGLTPEFNTFNSMSVQAENISALARERVFQELQSLLPLVTAQDLIDNACILTQVIPELEPTLEFAQNSPHHAYDVYTHTAHVVAAVPADPVLRFAALLHDVGKPQTYTQDENGIGHFYGHAAVSANIAEEILLQLKAPTALRQQVVTLIENHMTDLLPEPKFLKKKLARFGEDTLRNIIVLQEADFYSKGTGETTELFSQLRFVLDQVLAQGNCLRVKDLAINGNDLAHLGIAPGPQMGKILDTLLEMVLEETLENEKSALLLAAKELGGTL